MPERFTWETLLRARGFHLDGDRGWRQTTASVPSVPPAPAPRRQREDDEQRALLVWRDLVRAQEPCLDLLHHLANGKPRSKAVAGQLKALGVKAGMPDLFLPVARQGAHGLYLELKTRTGKLSPVQRALHVCLQEEGYAVDVCKGWVAAARTLCWYLDRDDLAQQIGGAR
jgi:hypothetical protein